MKLKLALLLFFFTFISYNQTTFAQNIQGVDSVDCWVMFTDKDGQTLDPNAYFDPKAIERRKRNDIPLVTYSDLPVRRDYISTVGEYGVVYQVSRWLNGAFTTLAVTDLHKISGTPGILEIWIRSRENKSAGIAETHTKLADDWWYGTLQESAKKQLNRMQIDAFHSSGYTGKGIRVAVFDAGFKHYKTNPAFKKVISDGRVIKTWDFTSNSSKVDRRSHHGTGVLSCIVGVIDDSIAVGAALDAEVLLAITERWTEFESEEEHWLAAAEWADQHGADIINSSLGYTTSRYFRYNLDGKTSIASRAADSASAKGILVVNSAGNEGDLKWKNLSTPADAETVLAVGGINPELNYHMGFSSYGPTWDKRMKPNVCAFALAVVANKTDFTMSSGTSFSSPLVAGFAACALSSDTSITRQQLFERIQESSDLYPYFDYAHGYGVPQGGAFLGQKDTFPGPPKISFYRTLDEIFIQIEGVNDTFGSLGYSLIEDVKVIGRAGNSNYDRMMFYHVENSKGYLDSYYLVDLDSSCNCGDYDEFIPIGSTPLVIDKNKHERPYILRVFYAGEIYEVRLASKFD